MLHKQALDPAAVALLVLDEADRMLDMGFEEAIREIISQLPAQRQSLLFSATWPAAIRAIGRSALRDPLEVSVEASGGQPVVEQWFHELGQEADKPAAVAGLLLQHRPESTVVFCNTRRDVDELVVALARFGIVSAALHGDLEQRDRDEVLLRFANRSLNVLVASDVAARGLDVKELACVINYELPGDPDIYLHRIGRTARAGSGGLALNLVSPREAARVLQLEDRHGLQPRWTSVVAAVAGAKSAPRATMSTLRIEAGRSDKLRPGDLLGALTGPAGLEAGMIGKIDIFPTRAYVAVRCDQAQRALAGLRSGGIKGRKFRVRSL
jgi:ATP-independent RNA helicase DbpA